MPLDHYIPQVHLRKFCSPKLGNRLYAIRKANLKRFTPTPKSVCAITDGSSNAYLRNDRAVEEFLKSIEPAYNAAIDRLIAKEINQECVYAIAGFASFVITCAPAGMRIHSEPLKKVVESTAEIMERQGLLPPAPPEVGASLTELLRNGRVKVTIDGKYPAALGIGSILERTSIFGNSRWEILHNEHDGSPFFASDFPVAIERSRDPRVLNRIIPLAPNLAVRIMPDITLEKSSVDLSFSKLRLRVRTINSQELGKLNELIVRCAEDTIFFRDDRPWVEPFVAKNRHFRIEPYTSKLKTERSTLQVSTQRIAKIDSSS
jgi:hypothetical protein